MQEAQELTTDLPERRATVWSFSVWKWRHATTTGADGAGCRGTTRKMQFRRRDADATIFLAARNGPLMTTRKSLFAALPCMANAVRLRPEIERCQESGREKTGILKKSVGGGNDEGCRFFVRDVAAFE